MKALARLSMAIHLLWISCAWTQERLYPDVLHNGKPTYLRGQGTRSCGTFIKDKQPFRIQNSGHAQDMAWALGFLYGIDNQNPYDTKFYDYNGLDLWLDRYCRDHPLESLANASLAFYVYIGGRFSASEDTSLWRHFPQYRSE